MSRMVRSLATGAVATATALAVFLGPACGAGASRAPAVATGTATTAPQAVVPVAAPAGQATATPPESGTPAPGTSPTGSPTPSPTPDCADCIDPQDAICWEGIGVCPIPLTATAPVPRDTTVLFRTVPGSARPWVDFVPVDGGKVTIPAGKQRATAVVMLVPDPKLTEPRTFQVKFFHPSYGRLTRAYVMVTIEPGKGRYG